MNEVADAIRNVTAAVQRAIDEGYRSRVIDADDLVEVLLAIADALDPPSRTPRGGRRSRHVRPIRAHDAPRSPRAGVLSLVGEVVKRPPPPPHGPTWANVANGTRRVRPGPAAHRICSSRSHRIAAHPFRPCRP